MRGAQSTIVLEHGPMRCTLVPDLGGAIAALTHHGRPVLRSSEGPDDVLQTACFPLVPFANRIEGGRFAFGGRDIVLEVAPEGAPHALHGHGWRSGWAVEQVTARSAVLRLDYAAAGWPWPYAAWQRLCLTSCELLVELTIENRHRSAAMPAGLGLHPYFPRTPATRIACAATHEWRNDPTGLAVSPAPSALFTGGEVPLELLAGRDNFFASPAPSAVIADAGHTVAIAADGAGFHLYCPPDLPFFCLEPVSHAPNSLGRGDMRGDDIIAPLARRSQRYRIAVTSQGTA